MPLAFPRAPAGTAAALHDLPPVPVPPDAEAGLPKPRTTSQAAGPVPIFRIGLQALKAGAGPRQARAAGWRFLLVRRARVAETAEVARESRTRFRLVAVSADGAGWHEALTSAEAHVAGAARRYRLAELHVPDLRLRALWLRTDRAAKDLFFVLPAAFPPFETGRPYAASEFAAECRALAAGAAQRRSSRRRRPD